jgi:hypothetical protein
MHKSWRAPLFALAVGGLLAMPGWSQEEEEFGGDGSEAATESAGDEVATSSEGGGGDGATNAPESYVVQPGDTLWNLSDRFLNNPWYWPKIWSYNPSLDNPNWIRPGTRIRFYPGPAETPIEVEPEPDFEDEPDFEEIARFEKGEGLDEAIARPPTANANSGRREFYLTNDEIQDMGRIINSPEEKEMLSDFDAAYFDMENKPNPGDVLQVFRVERDLRHPVTGENLGKVVHTLGVARVDRVSDDQSLGTVLTSWDAIYRGSYLGELDEVDISTVEPQPNESDVKGYVVDSARHRLRYLGENHMIFIDRGSGDGVKPGNTFVVVRAGDPYTGQVRGMADEDIGRLMAVDVGEKGSTCVVLNSLREVVPGDRIEMRAGE